MDKNDPAADAGRFIGVVSASLMIAVLFASYWMLTTGLDSTPSTSTIVQPVTPAK